MNTKPVPPDVKKICDDINHELNYSGGWMWLEPYFSGGDEYSDGEWRVRIVDQVGNLVCQHLQPSKLDWHTLKILLRARADYGRSEFTRGKVAAVNKIHQSFLEIVK